MEIDAIKCFNCGKKYSPLRKIFECGECGYSLDLVYGYQGIRKELSEEEEFFSLPVSHWKYRAFYPVEDDSKTVTLGEGSTPLIKSRENRHFHYKFEGVNPTGSFKDRGSTVEITKAREFREREVLCASTGNMGASVAAYSARAGIKARIFVSGFAPRAKVKQMRAFGATVKTVKGGYEKAVEKTMALRKKKGYYLTGDYPYRTEGQKSIAFEIIEQLRFECPEYIVCPIGNGTLIYSTYKGLKDFKKVGLIDEMPKLIGVQAEKCSPVVRAWSTGEKIIPVKNPKTIATAINIGNPFDGREALYAIHMSKGDAVGVKEREILRAQKELASEGIHSEASGAVALAGAKKLGLKDEAVIVVSGHGLKE